jgi:hypothetical protein
MINVDKREWKRSIKCHAEDENDALLAASAQINPNGTKRKNNGHDLQPLSPSEDLFLTTLTIPPFFHGSTAGFPNNVSLQRGQNLGGGPVRVAVHRLRHVSEPTSCGSASSDNDASDQDNNPGRILVGAVSRRTLFDIVALLNLIFPDYNYSQTKK